MESFLEWARWLAHAIAVEAPVHLTMDRVLMKEKIFTGQPVNCNGVGKGQLGLVAHFFSSCASNMKSSTPFAVRLGHETPSVFHQHHR